MPNVKYRILNNDKKVHLTAIIPHSWLDEIFEAYILKCKISLSLMSFLKRKM